MPENAFELAIVDPPYGINAPNQSMGSNPTRKGNSQYPGISTAKRLGKGRLNSGAGKLKNRTLNLAQFDWDNERPSAEYWQQLFRVSKHQVICGGNYFPLQPTRGIAIWDKEQPWDSFSQVELIWTSFDMPAKIFRYSNTGGANKEKRIHPTQKPVALYKWLLTHYAKTGDKILDTHGGSLSIAIACHDMGFDLTAYELDADYYSNSTNRVKKYIKQLQLFDPAQTFQPKQLTI